MSLSPSLRLVHRTVRSWGVGGFGSAEGLSVVVELINAAPRQDFGRDVDLADEAR